uniref:SfiI-subtelomeric related protein family member n=1 Tax=Theileria annulata TaxID=5874 RepID=A0A3B0N455_THEAN
MLRISFIFMCNIWVSYSVGLFYPLGVQDEIDIPNIPPGTSPNYNVNDPHNLVIDILSTNIPNVYKQTLKSECTNTFRYSSEDGYSIRRVVFGTKPVWNSTTKFEVAKTVEVVRKNGVLQLVSVKNDQLESFFRREKCSFVHVPTRQEYLKLKTSLDNDSTFVDTWVELDLSTSDPMSIFFSKDIYHEERVAIFKLSTLKPFKLFRVFDSETLLKPKDGDQNTETLWEFDDTLMCESVFVHNFQSGTLLKLFLSDGKINVTEDYKFFKKWDGNWYSIEKSEFVSEYNRLKSITTRRDITLDFGVNIKDERFYRKQEKLGKNLLSLALFPKTGYNPKRLFYDGTEVASLSGDQIFSSVVIYLENTEPVMVNATVSDTHREVKLVYFLKDGETLVYVEKEKYDSELAKLTLKGSEASSLKWECSDINLDEDLMDDTSNEVDDSKLESLVRIKFNVLYDIDDKYFTRSKLLEDRFELHVVVPKDQFIINLVDSHNGVVWKSVQHNFMVKSIVVYFKSQKPHGLKLLISGGNLSVNKYFVLSNESWQSTPVNAFYKLLNRSIE